MKHVIGREAGFLVPSLDYEEDGPGRPFIGQQVRCDDQRAPNQSSTLSLVRRCRRSSS